MSDVAYANALKRREELQRELLELDRFLALYRQFSGTNLEQIESKRLGGGLLQTPQGTLNLQVAKLGPSEYAAMAERLIREARHPLTRGELADGLLNRGVSFPTEDVPRYLGTILWRNRHKFINVPGQGYTLPDLLTLEQQSKIYEANARSADISDEVKSVLSQVADRLLREKSIEPVKPGSSVPPYADRLLLTVAGEELGRALYEPEKIALREAVILASLTL